MNFFKYLKKSFTYWRKGLIYFVPTSKDCKTPDDRYTYPMLTLNVIMAYKSFRYITSKKYRTREDSIRGKVAAVIARLLSNGDPYQDVPVRDFLEFGIENIIVYKSTVYVLTYRPGLVIGKHGTTVDKLTELFRKEFKDDKITIDIIEYLKGFSSNTINYMRAYYMY